MKIFTLSLLMAMIAFTSTAQITITEADYDLNIQGDIANYSIVDTTGGAVLIPQEGIDMVWDYSGLGFTIDNHNITYPGSNPSIPTANLRSEGNFVAFGVALPSTTYERYDSTGYSARGYAHVGADLPLASITGNTPDTLSIQYSISNYASPIYFIKFPCNYGDSMVNMAKSYHQHIANVAAFGLVDYEVNQEKTYISEYNVHGWGELVLYNENTMMNDTFEALLRQRVTTEIDSFFDATGNQVSGTLLSAFGFSQGGSYTVNRNSFFVRGLNGYALTVNTQNGIVINASLNKGIFETQTVATDVATKPNHIAHAIYPNPVQNHQFQIEFEKTSNKDWTFEMVNVLGQRVHQEMFSEGETTIQKTIRLDQSLQKGTYFYAVRDEYGQVVANGRLAL